MEMSKCVIKSIKLRFLQEKTNCDYPDAYDTCGQEILETDSPMMMIARRLVRSTNRLLLKAENTILQKRPNVIKKKHGNVTTQSSKLSIPFSSCFTQET